MISRTKIQHASLSNIMRYLKRKKQQIVTHAVNETWIIKIKIFQVESSCLSVIHKVYLFQSSPNFSSVHVKHTMIMTGLKVFGYFCLIIITCHYFEMPKLSTLYLPTPTKYTNIIKVETEFSLSESHSLVMTFPFTIIGFEQNKPLPLSVESDVI